MARRAVLVVDTDDTVVDAVRAATDSRTCRVIAVGDAHTAMGFLLHRRPALTVVNVDLDKGWRLCAEMRSDERFATIPLIIISAVASQEVFYQHQEFPTRADAYLHKPLDAQELSLSVDGLIDRENGDPVEDDDLLIFERREESRLDISLDGMDFGAGVPSAAPQRLPTHPEMGEIVQALQARIAQLEARLAQAGPEPPSAAGAGSEPRVSGVPRPGPAATANEYDAQTRQDLDALRRLDRELDAARRRAGLVPRAPVPDPTASTPGWARLRGRTIPPESLARMGIRSQAVEAQGDGRRRDGRAAPPRSPTNPPFGSRATTKPPFGSRGAQPTAPPMGSGRQGPPWAGSQGPRTKRPTAGGASAPATEPGGDASEPAWKRLRRRTQPPWEQPAAALAPPRATPAAGFGRDSGQPGPRTTSQRPPTDRPVPAWMALRQKGGDPGAALPPSAPAVPPAPVGEDEPPAHQGTTAAPPASPQEPAPTASPEPAPTASPPPPAHEPAPSPKAPPSMQGQSAKSTAQGMPPLGRAQPAGKRPAGDGLHAASMRPPAASGPDGQERGEAPRSTQSDRSRGKTLSLGSSPGPPGAPVSPRKRPAKAPARPRRRVSGRHRAPAPPRPGAEPPPLPPDATGHDTRSSAGPPTDAPPGDELASCLAGLRSDCSALEASAVLDARGQVVVQDLPDELRAIELDKLAAAARHARQEANADTPDRAARGARGHDDQLIHPLRAGVTVVTPVTTPNGERASLVTLHRRGPRLDRDLRAARRAAARIHALL